MARLITASFDLGADMLELGGHLFHQYGGITVDFGGQFYSGNTKEAFVKTGVRSLGVYSNGLFDVADSLVSGLQTTDWVADRVYFYKFHFLYVKGDNVEHSGFSSPEVNQTTSARYLPFVRPVFAVSAVDYGSEFHVRLIFDNADHLVVEHNNASVGAVMGAAVLQEGVWYELRIEFKISEAAAGYMKVWIDGVLDVDDSGVDTRYNALDFVHWKFGHFTIDQPLFGYDYYYDNLFVNDDQPSLNQGHLPDGLVLFIFTPESSTSNTPSIHTFI